MRSNEKISIQRSELFIILKDLLNNELTKTLEVVENYVSKKANRKYYLSEEEKKSVSYLLYRFRTLWKESARTESRFRAKNQEWLNGSIVFNDQKASGETNTEKRHSKSFAECSDRSKRRRTQQLRQEYGAEELAFATQMSLRSAGQVDAAHVVKRVSEGSPSKASSYRSSEGQVKERTLTPEEALSVFIEANFSKRQYLVVRSGCTMVNSKAYPSYVIVAEAKKMCYPDKESITITETCGSISLQSLLNHTVKRILNLRTNDILNLKDDVLLNLNLICKWGCDGTSGQSVYKQKFSSNDDAVTDSSIFFTSLVPLRLLHIAEDGTEMIIWQNPRPSSSRFCRPIKVEYLKETPETTRNEVKYVEDQVENLVPFNEYFRGKNIKVRYSLSLTMVDGKVCNALSETDSAQRCYLCNATSKDFNDINMMVGLDINETNLEFGISSLHAWIRCFECCLHLSYKLDIKKWQARGANVKKIVEKRKADTQKAFKEKLGLIVDQPKQGGSSNDGNTARRFFQEAATSSEITNIDVRLIRRFHVILQLISSNYDIDISKYEKFAFETAELFVDLYPWYPMPTTIHKLLIHGPLIIASALLPIGQMSEEAQEASNKLIKKYRRDFSRKHSRKATMTDVFHRLLLSSDPFVSSVRKIPKKQKKSLLYEARQMIINDSDTESEVEISDVTHESDFEVDSD
ncbi:PREDICTED: uncharacterized protein LOC108756365 [Trachymyrmex septentrionalis]|uniref:uncharacterized protein LOC108746585 n=1 Tax=Trachymyrmex septentrionalis TaxID=34720 RepID=UPI00084EF33C|nr:PREDICTED: uncharacterized protein LOC108746585 [Trachymyrmex septentrionalis]XP_018343251.1 PREDICTED: uncharacterized protein LOC108749199 [Trachymyrmex septentrionalis]XP_018355608.1 PREDICTED: uncharacterized protein LOC108756365 [Trachymyrmex septentrionalis]